MSRNMISFNCSQVNQTKERHKRQLLGSFWVQTNQRYSSLCPHTAHNILQTICRADYFLILSAMARNDNGHSFITLSLKSSSHGVQKKPRRLLLLLMCDVIPLLLLLCCRCCCCYCHRALGSCICRAASCPA